MNFQQMNNTVILFDIIMKNDKFYNIDNSSRNNNNNNNQKLMIAQQQQQQKQSETEQDKNDKSTMDKGSSKASNRLRSNSISSSRTLSGEYNPMLSVGGTNTSSNASSLEVLSSSSPVIIITNAQQQDAEEQLKRQPPSLLSSISQQEEPNNTHTLLLEKLPQGKSKKLKTTTTNDNNNKKRSIRKQQHPPDKPRRPVCAYNIFFHLERERLLQHSITTQQHNINNMSTNNNNAWTSDEISKAAFILVNRPKRKHIKVIGGSISFTELSRYIAMKWKSVHLSVRKLFEQQANIIAKDYVKKVEEWKSSKEYQEHMQQQKSEQPAVITEQQQHHQSITKRSSKTTKRQSNKQHQQGDTNESQNKMIANDNNTVANESLSLLLSSESNNNNQNVKSINHNHDHRRKESTQQLTKQSKKRKYNKRIQNESLSMLTKSHANDENSLKLKQDDIDQVNVDHSMNNRASMTMKSHQRSEVDIKNEHLMWSLSMPINSFESYAEVHNTDHIFTQDKKHQRRSSLENNNSNASTTFKNDDDSIYNQQLDPNFNSSNNMILWPSSSAAAASKVGTTIGGSQSTTATLHNNHITNQSKRTASKDDHLIKQQHQILYPTVYEYNHQQKQQVAQKVDLTGHIDNNMNNNRLMMNENYYNSHIFPSTTDSSHHIFMSDHRPIIHDETMIARGRRSNNNNYQLNNTNQFVDDQLDEMVKHGFGGITEEEADLDKAFLNDINNKDHQNYHYDLGQTSQTVYLNNEMKQNDKRVIPSSSSDMMNVNSQNHRYDILRRGNIFDVHDDSSLLMNDDSMMGPDWIHNRILNQQQCKDHEHHIEFNQIDQLDIRLPSHLMNETSLQPTAQSSSTHNNNIHSNMPPPTRTVINVDDNIYNRKNQDIHFDVSESISGFPSYDRHHMMLQQERNRLSDMKQRQEALLQNQIELDAWQRELSRVRRQHRQQDHQQTTKPRQHPP